MKNLTLYENTITQSVYRSKTKSLLVHQIQFSIKQTSNEEATHILYRECFNTRVQAESISQLNSESIQSN